MKVVLTILCALVALFGGGCAVVLFGNAGLLSLLPLAVLVLNGLVVYGLWSADQRWRPAYYILGVVDGLIAIGLFITFFSAGLNSSGPDGVLLLLPLAFLGKGVLTLIYARRV